MELDFSLHLPQEKYLLDGETPLMVVHQSSVVLARPLLEFGGLLALVIWLADSSGPAVQTIFGYLLLAAVGRTLWQVSAWDNKVLMLTDRRLCLTSGVLTKKLAVMPLLEITDLTYVRSPGGQLVGYGELVLESAGQDQGLDRIPFLAHPDRVYRTVQKAQEDARDRRYRKMAGTHADKKAEVRPWTDLDGEAPDFLREVPRS